MKKLIAISSVFVLLLAFSACEKQTVKPGDPANDPFSLYTGGENNTRGHENDGDPNLNSGGGPSITDPDEDEDYDNKDGGIVDPDEDEDYDNDDNDGNGK